MSVKKPITYGFYHPEDIAHVTCGQGLTPKLLREYIFGVSEIIKSTVDVSGLGYRYTRTWDPINQTHCRIRVSNSFLCLGYQEALKQYRGVTN